MESRLDYPSEHLEGLNKMRRQDQLCDVTIQVEGRKFRAHKAVLAATGDYFLTMFTSGFRESSAQEITIEHSAAAFKILLNFVYTGEVERSKLAPCMYEVLEMACYMQFTEFREICSSAIRKLLKTTTDEFSLSDVCKVMLLAQKQQDLSSLYKATLKYLEDKVENLKSVDLFLENVSATFLQQFLGRENLSTASEEEHVLELVINWLKHDWEKRKGHSHQLLQKVRLGLVASEVVKKLIGPEILEIPGCSELMKRVLDLHASQKPMEALAIENPDIAASRSNIMAPVKATSQGKMQYYDMERKKWVGMKKMDPLPKTKTDKYELIVVSGVLYAAGGSGEKEFLKYDGSENKWLPLPSKPLGKMRIKLVAHGAYIFAFGACCESDVFMIERYDINAEKWEVLKKVQESKSDYSTSRFNLVAMDSAETTDCGWHCRDDQSYHIFALVFEGKIYVSSLEKKRDDARSRYSNYGKPKDIHYLVEKLAIFDPKTNTCQVLDLYLDSRRREEEHGRWKRHFFKPTLFIYKDYLCRMIVESCFDECPVYVSKLSLTYGEDGMIIARLGKELRPGLQLNGIPDYGDAPFYIQDKIFVKGSSKRSKASGRDKVKSIPQYGENKQLMCIKGDRSKCLYPVWLSFEKKKLTVPKKKKWTFSDDDMDEDYDRYDDSDSDDDSDSYDESDDEEDYDDEEEEEGGFYLGYNMYD